jgi:hypothetical protein
MALNERVLKPRNVIHMYHETYSTELLTITLNLAEKLNPVTISLNERVLKPSNVIAT